MTRTNFRLYVEQIFKRTDKTTEMNQAIDDTLRDMAIRYSFEVLRAQSYVPTVTGQEDYPLPSTLLHLHHPVKLLQGSATSDSGWPLKKLSKEEYDVAEPNPNRTSPVKGIPWGYTIWSDSILLVSVPDRVYNLEINWGKQITVPTADGDTVGPFPAYADETIRAGVLSRTYEVIELMAESEKWELKYERKLQALIDRDKGQAEHIGHVAFNAL